MTRPSDVIRDHLTYGGVKSLALDALAEMESRCAWQDIATAPTTDKDFFLVCCDDPRDERSPFVVRGDIFQLAIKKGTPHHLSLNHLTHWMELPKKPVGTEEGK